MACPRDNAVRLRPAGPAAPHTSFQELRVLSQQSVEAQAETGAARQDPSGLVVPRAMLFALLLAASVIVFWTPLGDLVGLSLRNEEFSYLPVIPVVCLIVFYLERAKIFLKTQYSVSAGALLLLAGIALDYLPVKLAAPGQGGWLSLKMLSVVVVWIAGFVLCYGARAFRAAVFPVLLSFLMVPLPKSVIHQPLVVIQHGSAEVVYLFFKLTGLPVFRDGMNFSLPGLDVEVAPQCSGIHSTFALLIAALLVGHFGFKSGWKKIALIALVFPIVSLTNGFRIFGLAVLAVYVDPAFMMSSLHRDGGAFFFLLALSLLAMASKLLRPQKAKEAMVNSAAAPSKTINSSSRTTSR